MKSEPGQTRSWCWGKGLGGAYGRGSPTVVLAAVNGSPATITIETCEDPGDWSMAIGGAGPFLWAPPGWRPGARAPGRGRWAGGVLAEGGAVLGGCVLLPADPRARLGPAQLVCVAGAAGVSSLWLEVRRLGSRRDFHSLSLSFHPRRHVCLLARAQGRRPTGRGHPGVPPGADGDHEGPAAASPGPSPAAPR